MFKRTIFLILVAVFVTACSSSSSDSPAASTPPANVDVDSFEALAKASDSGTNRVIEFPSLGVTGSAEGGLTRDKQLVDGVATDVDWLDTNLSDLSVKDAKINASLTDAAISVAYNNGNLSAATVTLDANTSYTLDISGGTARSLTGGIDGAFGFMTVGRGEGYFGFESNYMINAHWVQLDLSGTSSDVDDNFMSNTNLQIDGIKVDAGFLVAGFETGSTISASGLNIDNGALPTNGSAKFNGRGFGYYASGVSAASQKVTDILQQTEFDVNVTADFASSKVSIAAVNTMGYACEALEARCPDAVRTDLRKLDFATGAISYTGNDISKALAVDGMTGNVDARFYGPTANEFGGTFAVAASNTDYYYGSLGAKRGDHAIRIADINSFDDFSDETTLDPNEQARAIDFSSLAVSGTLNGTLTRAEGTDTSLLDTPLADYMISDAVITASSTNPTFSVTYDDGAISLASVKLADTTYILDNSDGTRTRIDAGIQNEFGYMEANRVGAFGFESDYMINARWVLLPDGSGDFGDDSTNAALESVSGFLVAGFETGATIEAGHANINTGALPTTDSATFSGRGVGYYASDVSATKQSITNIFQQTEFDVNVTADFANTSVSIAAINTNGYVCETLVAQCPGANRIVLPELDFDTGDIEYTGNNISYSFITGNAVNGMTGDVNARFYGPTADEFGGTFALAASNTDYYYGAFGAKRGDHVDAVELITVGETANIASVMDANVVATAPATFLTTGAIDLSETSISLQGLAVSLSDETSYERNNANIAWDITDKINLEIVRTATILNIVEADGKVPAVTITTAEGAITGATVFADAEYTASVEIGAVSDDNFFGFETSHMAYVSWTKTETADDLDNTAKMASLTDVKGMMIAGIESQGNDFDALVGSYAFTGKGSGVFGTKDGTNITSQDVTFDVTADIDFTNNTASISTSNTCGVAGEICDSSDLDYFATANNWLNFSANASDVTGNEISVANLNRHSQSYGLLFGTLEARLYGADGDELGGTFSFHEGAAGDDGPGYYYYGAFGAERGAYTPPFMGSEMTTINALAANATNVVSGAPIENHKGYGSVADAARQVAGIDIQLKGLSVALNDVTNYEREFAFDADFALVDWDIADKADFIIDRQITPVRITDSIVDIEANNTTTVNKVYADAEYSSATADRSTVFGFGSDYMVFIDWETTNTVSGLNNYDTEGDVANSQGMMIAGIETATILGAGKVDFTGKGKGVYGTTDGTSITSEAVTFNVTAAVDFKNSNVTITTDTTTGANALTNLDFTTGAINYGNSNSINTSLTDAGGVAGLNGQIDARFYGAGSEEFGGAFALANTTNYYYGAFGANHVGKEFSYDSFAETASGTSATASTKVSVFTTGLVAESTITADLTRYAVGNTIEKSWTGWGRLDNLKLYIDSNPVTQYQNMAETGTAGIYKVNSVGPDGMRGTDGPDGIAGTADDVVNDDVFEYVRKSDSGTESVAGDEWVRVVLTDDKGDMDASNDVYSTIARTRTWLNTDNKDITVSNASLAQTDTTGSEISVTYDEGVLSAVDVTVGSKNYKLANSNSTGTAILLDEVFLDSSDNPVDTKLGRLEVARDEAAFGFESKYMVRARWTVVSASLIVDSGSTSLTGSTGTSGFMVAGYETATLPTSGTATFKGKGAGYYVDNEASIPLTLDKASTLTEFDVDVTADFAGTVSITTSSTMGYACPNEFIKTRCSDADKTDLSALLDFDIGGITYTGNNISHSFTAGNEVNGMLGDVDGRFYGAGAEEFGGTFNLSSATKSYTGAFGANKQ